MAVLTYRVNANDEFVFVGADWTRFAVENGLPPWKANVIGTSLWNHLTDLTTRHFYRIFMHRVRQTGQSISVPFRCDAPDRRRFMQMTMRRMPDNAIEFCSETIREEPRPIVDLLNPTFPRRTDFILMCSWCKKIKTPEWVEVEEGVARLDLFSAAKLPWISHGICPDCERHFIQEQAM